MDHKAKKHSTVDIDKNHYENISPNSLDKTILLAYFFGTFGGHRFYNRKYFTGLLQLITMGGFFIWWILDLINLGQEKFTDDKDRVLKWKYKIGERTGFSIRFTAYLIDMVIVNLIIEFLFLLLALDYLLDANEVLITNYLHLVRLSFIMLYFVVFNYFYKATPGKICMKLEILSEDNSDISLIQSIIRYIGYFFSGILFIGFLMIGYRKDRRALHDLIASTKVVYIGPGE